MINIINIIATIIDPAATLLNVTGDSASSMLVTRIVEGRGWLNKKKKKFANDKKGIGDNGDFGDNFPKNIATGYSKKSPEVLKKVA